LLIIQKIIRASGKAKLFKYPSSKKAMEETETAPETAPETPEEGEAAVEEKAEELEEKED